jgi:hypothetical protein
MGHPTGRAHCIHTQRHTCTNTQVGNIGNSRTYNIYIYIHAGKTVGAGTTSSCLECTVTTLKSPNSPTRACAATICDLDSLAGEAVAALKLLCADKPAYMNTVKQEPAGGNTTLPPVLVKINDSLMLPRLHEPAPVQNNCAGNNSCNQNSKQRMHSGHTASLVVNSSHLTNHLTKSLICNDKGLVVNCNGLDTATLYSTSATVGYHALMSHSLRKFSDVSTPPSATIATDHSAAVKAMVDFNSISGIAHTNNMSISTSVDHLVDRCAVYTHVEAANVHAHLGALLQAGVPAEGTDLGALLCRSSH